MAQIQAIKGRIKSVSNTKQITKAMELVSASKMRRAQDATLRSRVYTSSAQDILSKLAILESAAEYPLFKSRPVKNRLIIFITSNMTLAGAYNSNLDRLLLDQISLAQAAGEAVKVIVVGSVGARFANKLSGVELIGVYSDWSATPSATEAAPIVHTAINSFNDGSIDAVDVVYTQFRSMITQTAGVMPLLPVAIKAETEADQAITNDDALVFEPSPAAVLESVVPRLVEALAYQAVLESSASEQSMRMMAMKNASDNATDLIDDLTLAYNSARQAGITQELAEITAGAEAIQ